jgi:3-deoxy-D-manno-octulosonic-acid transferase
MEWIYRALSRLLSPLLIRRLQRGEADPEARRADARQRRGHIESCGEAPIWIHAASVGEVNAISPLVQALRKRHPSRALVVSTFTRSGADQLRRRFGDTVGHRFLPVDTPAACARWLDALQPAIGLIAETEIWPVLFDQCRRRAIPLLLVNARLSERGLKRSRYLRSLFAHALEAVDRALCQSRGDAERLIELGLEPARAEVVGNLKFDAPLADDVLQTAQGLRSRWGARRVWVAGSTRRGEEPLVLEAQRQLKASHPDALLILAPRHPERCEEIGELIERAALSQQRLDHEIDGATDVVLVDRLGVLQACYAAGAVAFVGGSLVPIGGHNLLEPAALGKPVIAGTSLENQQAMAQALDAVEALERVTSADDLAAAVSAYWDDPARALAKGRAALSVVEAGRGALASTLNALRARLEGVSAGAG